MKNNKRGLSNIVATVLIVLLSLAAVAIVWGFLRPTFDTAASQTALQSKCFSVDIQPESCTYTTYANNDNLTIRVRNLGKEARFIVVDAVDSMGVSRSSMKKPAGNTLDTIVFINQTIGNLQDGDVRGVSVAGVVVGSANEEFLCPPRRIDCIAINLPPQS